MQTKKLIEHMELSRRLNDVTRFTTRPFNNKLTVGEHSFRVSHLVMLLGYSGGVNEGTVSEAIRKALMHDMEEGLTGDIPSPVKNSSDTFKTSYNIMSRHFMYNLLIPYFYRFWRKDKKGASGELVYLADNLEAFASIYEEILSGNERVREIYERFVAEVPSIYGDYINKYPLVKELVLKYSTLSREVSSGAISFTAIR